MSELSVITSIQRLHPYDTVKYAYFTVHVALSWATPDGTVSGEQLIEGNRDLLLPWRWNSVESVRICRIRGADKSELVGVKLLTHDDAKFGPSSEIYGAINKGIDSLVALEKSGLRPAMWAADLLPHERPSGPETTLLKDYVGYLSTLCAPIPQGLNLAYVVQIDKANIAKDDVLVPALQFAIEGGAKYTPADPKTTVEERKLPLKDPVTTIWRWPYSVKTPKDSKVAAHSAGILVSDAPKQPADSSFADLGSLWVNFAKETPKPSDAEAGWFAEDWQARLVDRSAQLLDFPRALLTELGRDAAGWQADPSKPPLSVKSADAFRQIGEVFLASLRDLAHASDLKAPGAPKGLLSRWWQRRDDSSLVPGSLLSGLDLMREALRQFDAALNLETWAKLLQVALPGNRANSLLVSSGALTAPVSPEEFARILADCESVYSAATSDAGVAAITEETWRRALATDSVSVVPGKQAVWYREALTRALDKRWRITWDSVDLADFVTGDVVGPFVARFEVQENPHGAKNDSIVGLRLVKADGDIGAQWWITEDGAAKPLGSPVTWAIAPAALKASPISVRLAFDFSQANKIALKARVTSARFASPLVVAAETTISKLELVRARASVAYDVEDVSPKHLRAKWPTPDVQPADEPDPPQWVRPDRFLSSVSQVVRDEVRADAARRATARAFLGEEAFKATIRSKVAPGFDERARLGKAFSAVFGAYAQARASGNDPKPHARLTPLARIADDTLRTHLIEAMTAAVADSATEMLVPPTAEGDWSPVPVAHPVQIPFDNVAAEPTPGTKEDVEDWTRAVSGVGVLVRQTMPDAKPGKWRLLNLARLDQVLQKKKDGDEDLENPDQEYQSCVTLAAFRTSYIAARRTSGVTYDNDPLVGESPLLGYSRKPGLNKVRLKSPDTRRHKLAHESDVSRLIEFDAVDPTMKHDLASWAALPGLAFGQTYDFAAFLVGHGGALPRALAVTGNGIPYPVLLDSMANAAPRLYDELDKDPAKRARRVRSVRYLRRTRVGVPRWRLSGTRPAKDDIFPPIPAGVFPLAQELQRTGVVRVGAFQNFFFDGANRRGTLALEAGSPGAARRLVTRAIRCVGEGVGFAIKVIRDPDDLAIVVATLTRIGKTGDGLLEVATGKDGVVVKDVKIGSAFSASHEVDVEIAYPPRPAGPEVPNASLTVTTRVINGSAAPVESAPVWFPWNAADGQVKNPVGRVSITATTGPVNETSVVFEPPTVPEDVRPGDDDLPLLLLAEEPRLGIKTALNLEIRKPTTDLGTWDRWIRRDWWLLKDNAKRDEILTLQSDVVDAYFEKGRPLTAPPQADLPPDQQLEDPCLEPTFLIEVVPLTSWSESPPKVTWAEFQTTEFPWNEDDIVAPRDKAHAELECQWVAEANPQFELTSNNAKTKATLKIAAGTVAEVRIHPLVKQSWFQGTTARFPSSWARGLDPYRTFYKLEPRRFMVEAVSKRAPAENDILEALEPSFDGRGVVVDFKPAGNPSWKELRYVKDVELRRQVWRWDGTPVTTFPSHTFEPDDDAHLTWDVAGFGHRDDDDSTLHASNLPLSPRSTRLLTQALEHDPRAQYYRFSLLVKSRYGPLVDVRVQARDSKRTPNLLGWKRLLVPCRRRGEVAKPSVRMVVPLTVAERPDDAKKSPGPAGLLVVIDEGWFEYAGLAESLEVEIARAGYPESSLPEDRDQEVGPDPIVIGSDGVFTSMVGFDQSSIVPIGHTFDTDSSAPRFVATSFYVPSPEGLSTKSWAMARIRFRRRVRRPPSAGLDADASASAWTSPHWVQFLPDSETPPFDSMSHVSAHELGDSEDGAWVLATRPAGGGPPTRDRLEVREPVMRADPPKLAPGFHSIERWVLLSDRIYDVHGRREDESWLGLLESVDGRRWISADHPDATAPSQLLKDTRHAPRARIVDVQSRREVLPYPFAGLASNPRTAWYYGREGEASLALEQKPISVVVRRLTAIDTGLRIELKPPLPMPLVWAGVMKIQKSSKTLKVTVVPEGQTHDDDGDDVVVEHAYVKTLAVPPDGAGGEVDLHFRWEVDKVPIIEARWSGGSWEELAWSNPGGTPPSVGQAGDRVAICISLTEATTGFATFLAPVACSSRAMEPWARLFPLDDVAPDSEDARSRIVAVSPPIDAPLPARPADA